jgi:hypothetical protein
MRDKLLLPGNGGKTGAAPARQGAARHIARLGIRL